MRILVVLALLLVANPLWSNDFSGESRLWFTLATIPLQATGLAGRAKEMQRFPNAADLQNLRSECFGFADANGLGQGHCVNTAPNGDLWVERYECSKPVLPPKGAFAACEGTATVLGGTGQFADITGSGQFTMLTTILAPDGMRIVFAPGEYHLHW